MLFLHKRSTKRNIEAIRNSGLFDLQYYCKQAGEFATADEAINHFLGQPIDERANPSDFFDIRYYLDNHHDVRDSNSDPLLHFIEYGQIEGRICNSAAEAGLGHIKLLNLAQKLSILRQAEEFDPAYYLSENPDVKEADVDPHDHYLQSAISEQRNPSAAFSTSYYLKTNPSLLEHGLNPLVHYLLHGRATGRHPLPPIDDSQVCEITGLSRKQQLQLIRNSAEFDEEYYNTIYSDLKIGGLDAATHYLETGYLENRNPSAVFSTKYYLEANPDIKNAGINPLIHYLHVGRKERRRYSPTFIDGYKLSFPAGQKSPAVTLPVSYGITPTSIDKIGVHIHCHYIDIARLIFQRLSRLELNLDLFISTTSPDNLEPIKKACAEKQLNIKKIIVSPNRGRDIAPMIIEFGKDLLQYSVALHLHTKKSVEKADAFGAQWRKDLERKLIFNPAYCQNIISLFENNAQLGLVYPEKYWRIAPFLTWGRNFSLANEFLTSLGIEGAIKQEGKPEFPAGSMFWFKPKALEQLLNSKLGYTDFPEEPIPDDGTLAHAIERCFTAVGKHNQYEAITTAPLAYESSWPKYLKPKISIIIPVYNCGPWLRAAVESILRQDSTHIPYEIILVDNGSTDESQAIASTYAELYHNIDLYHEPQKGAGNARNLGLQKAQGDYISFLDADDLLTSDALSNLIAATIKYPAADLVTSSLVMFDEDGPKIPIPFGQNKEPAKNIGNIQHTQDIGIWEKVFRDLGACAKVYRRQFLNENNIQFPADKNFEDNLFVYQAYLKAESVALIERPTYFYRKFSTEKGQTQSTTLNKDAFTDQIWVLEQILLQQPEGTPDNIKRLIDQSLAVKLGWEFNRLESADAAAGLLKTSAPLYKCIAENNHWHLLGEKAFDIRALLEETSQDGSQQ